MSSMRCAARCRRIRSRSAGSSLLLIAYLTLPAVAALVAGLLTASRPASGR